MKFIAAAAFAALTAPYAPAQSACRLTRATALSGTVRDSTQALIPGASVSVDGGAPVLSGADGRFRLPCLPSGKHQLSVEAPGFEPIARAVTTPSPGDVVLLLQPGSVSTNVTVNADEGVAPDPNGAGPTMRLEGQQLQSLADDPDDLLRELQQMAAAAGGNPANVTISVDGFGDSSKLPPKSSIAYIEVNPDLFSSEYREPPFGGGQVNVYTKPGKSAYHGALFTTNGSSWENARDPFSTSKGAVGKQRYGFEFTGPVRKQGSDFSLDLEHRSIDNVGVVNAVSLNGAGQTVPVLDTVETPQRLWVGQARLDWQLGAKNVLTATYSANVNNLQNVGVGGTNLRETGYSSEQAEHVLRFTNLTTFSPHLVHEARASLKWNIEDELPTSTLPQVQVAGSFTGGGSTLGAQRLFGFRTEFDEDAILTLKQHTLKFGFQDNNYDIHNRFTTNFNGTYIFGGGTAPVLDANNQPVAGQAPILITGFEQYRRATLHLSGGTPTAFSNVVGTPEVNFLQSRVAFFVQDSWKLPHGVLISGGLRYFFQTDPTTLSSVQPRLGILWSPGAKPKWTLYAHAGLFAGNVSSNEYAEVRREDGVQRITSTIYNPVYSDPFSAGAIPIHSIRSFNPRMTAASWAAENIGASRQLPGGFNVSGDFFYGRIWNDQRSPNINSPLNNLPTGPRARGIANLNNLQMNNSGQGHIFFEFFGVEQHSIKNLTFFAGLAHADLIDDTDDSALSSPQSEFTDAGEFAHRTGQGTWQIFGNGSFTFPKKIVLSGDLNAEGDRHYNITTGYDNNGDGNFNDRPQIALPGTPGAVPTRYGLLTDTGGIAALQRNVGIMPWTVHLDANLQHAFVMTHDAKAEHQQTLTVNLRSSNLLNHTNIIAVGGVLGSPLFGVGYDADAGRRVEAGLRYSF